MAAPVRAGDAPRGTPARVPGRWWPAVSAGLAAVAAAALLLPWWRAGAGPVLLGGRPLRALPADSWTGVEVAGGRALVVAGLAVVAVVAGAPPRAKTGGRACVVAAGAAAAACGVAALVGWGPTGAPGAWVAAAAGVAAVAVALVRSTGAGSCRRSPCSPLPALSWCPRASRSRAGPPSVRSCASPRSGRGRCAAASRAWTAWAAPGRSSWTARRASSPRVASSSPTSGGAPVCSPAPRTVRRHRWEWPATGWHAGSPPTRSP